MWDKACTAEPDITWAKVNNCYLHGFGYIVDMTKVVESIYGTILVHVVAT